MKPICLAAFRRALWTMLVLGLAAAPFAGATPEIFSPEPEFNFGSIDNEQLIVHDFIVRNVGTSPLELKRVQTSCGCTVAELKQKVLAPGEETQVTASLNNKGKTGVQTRQLLVESNDPKQPRYRLIMTGTAVSNLTMDPQLLAFGRIMNGQTHQKSFTITASKRAQPLQITDVVSTVPHFTPELRMIEEGVKYEVLVTTSEALPPGPVNGQIVLMQEKTPNEIRMNVVAQVIGDYEVQPPQVQVRASSNAGDTAEQYILIKGGRVKEFEITQVISPVDSMKVDIQPMANSTYRLHLQGMPMDGSLDGKEMIIQTTNAQAPELRVPFRMVQTPVVQRAVRAGGAGQ